MEHDEGAALVLLPGRAALPGPRLLRILRNLPGKQLSAAAARTQRAVSGQASFAGRAVRRAHSESQADRPENEFIHFPAGFLAFLCPVTRLACFKLQADTACFLFQAGSPEWVQGAMHPGVGFRAAEALTFFPSAIFQPLQRRFSEEEQHQSVPQSISSYAVG